MVFLHILWFAMPYRNGKREKEAKVVIKPCLWRTPARPSQNSHLPFYLAEADLGWSHLTLSSSQSHESPASSTMQSTHSTNTEHKVALHRRAEKMAQMMESTSLVTRVRSTYKLHICNLSTPIARWESKTRIAKNLAGRLARRLSPAGKPERACVAASTKWTGRAYTQKPLSSNFSMCTHTHAHTHRRGEGHEHCDDLGLVCYTVRRWTIIS